MDDAEREWLRALEGLASRIGAIERIGERAVDGDAQIVPHLVHHLRNVLDLLVGAGLPSAATMPWWREWRADREQGSSG